jgi:plasmid stabilization system protein ParE
VRVGYEDLPLRPGAEAALDRQIDYLLQRDAGEAARKLERRLRSFIEQTLCRFPFIGTHIQARGIFEIWVPGTKCLLWYSLTDDAVPIAMIWHTSQDRAAE